MESFRTMLEVGQSGKSLLQKNAGIVRTVSERDHAGRHPKFRALRARGLNSNNTFSITDLRRHPASWSAFDMPRSALARCKGRDVSPAEDSAIPDLQNGRDERRFRSLLPAFTDAGVVVVFALFSPRIDRD